jgi:hypothetical protein
MQTQAKGKVGVGLTWQKGPVLRTMTNGSGRVEAGNGKYERLGEGAGTSYRWLRGSFPRKSTSLAKY